LNAEAFTERQGARAAEITRYILAVVSKTFIEIDEFMMSFGDG